MKICHNKDAKTNIFIYLSNFSDRKKEECETTGLSFIKSFEISTLGLQRREFVTTWK